MNNILIVLTIIIIITIIWVFLGFLGYIWYKRGITKYLRKTKWKNGSVWEKRKKQERLLILAGPINLFKTIDWLIKTKR